MRCFVSNTNNQSKSFILFFAFFKNENSSPKLSIFKINNQNHLKKVGNAYKKAIPLSKWWGKGWGFHFQEIIEAIPSPVERGKGWGFLFQGIFEAIPFSIWRWVRGDAIPLSIWRGVRGEAIICKKYSKLFPSPLERGKGWGFHKRSEAFISKSQTFKNFSSPVQRYRVRYLIYLLIYCLYQQRWWNQWA